MLSVFVQALRAARPCTPSAGLRSHGWVASARPPSRRTCDKSYKRFKFKQTVTSFYKIFLLISKEKERYTVLSIILDFEDSVSTATDSRHTHRKTEECLPDNIQPRVCS